MSTLREWADDLRRAADDVLDEADRVVSKGALNIKNHARELISGRAHLPHYPHSIGYDMERGEGEVSAHIGADRDKKQGTLLDVLEHGSINNAPIPHFAPAADAEEPRLERATADLGEKLLGER